jgi:hypothetical protein
LPSLQRNHLPKVQLYYLPQILSDLELSLKYTKYGFLLRDECHAEKIIHFISHLYLLSIIDNRYDRDSFIHISSKFLKHYYTKGHYKQIIEALKHAEILEVNESYEVGVKTKAYRIAPRYVGFKFKVHSLKPSSLISKKHLEYRNNKLKGIINKDDKRIPKRVYNKLEKTLHQVTINYSAAQKFILARTVSFLKNPETIEVKQKGPVYFKEGEMKFREVLSEEQKEEEFRKLAHACHEVTGIKVTQSEEFTLEMLQRVAYTYQSDMIAIQMIHDKQFHFSIDQNGRAHSNITNLNGDLRKFLLLNGKPLQGTDLRNSQPTFFALLLLERFEDKKMPEDVHRYINLCLEGKFYDVLMDDAGIEQSERKKFKVELFGNVFFNKVPNKRWNKHQKAFKEVFPNAWDVIVEMKSDIQTLGEDNAYKALANELQKKETHIMIHLAAAECLRRDIPIISIHDALYTHPEKLDELCYIILGKFADKYGVTPTLEKTK